MNETINSILENSKKAYKKSILIENDELADLLFLLFTDLKKLLDEYEDKKTKVKNITSSARTEEEEITRIKKKIPLWFSKPNQYNHKILVAYLKLSNNNEIPVSLIDLERECGLDNSYKFNSNFSQMKMISYKNHGKVFTEENGVVTLWEPLSSFIVDEYERNEKIIMNKKEIGEVLSKKFPNEKINTKNGGNFKIAKYDNKKMAFWYTIDLDYRIKEEYFLVLNDIGEEKIIVLKIPANTFNIDIFSKREKEDKLDIYVSSKDDNYLMDIKSGGTKFDFKPYIIDTIVK